MAAVFLRALAGGATVYEASVTGGTITGPAISPALIATVDWLQFFDPAVQPELQTPRLEFSVYSGSLQPGNFPRQINFNTRCFLTPKGTTSAAPIHLSLQVSGADVVLSEAQVFGQYPDSHPTFPIAITAFLGQTFTPTMGSLGVMAFVPPDVTSRLGIEGFYQRGNGAINPQLVCSAIPHQNKIQFSLSLPLAAKEQQVRTYGLSFDYNGKTIPQRADGLPRSPLRNATVFRRREFRTFGF